MLDAQSYFSTKYPNHFSVFLTGSLPESKLRIRRTLSDCGCQISTITLFRRSRRAYWLFITRYNLPSSSHIAEFDLKTNPKIRTTFLEELMQAPFKRHTQCTRRPSIRYRAKFGSPQPCFFRSTESECHTIRSNRRLLMWTFAVGTSVFGTKPSRI